MVIGDITNGYEVITKGYREKEISGTRGLD